MLVAMNLLPTPVKSSFTGLVYIAARYWEVPSLDRRHDRIGILLAHTLAADLALWQRIGLKWAT